MERREVRDAGLPFPYVIYLPESLPTEGLPLIIQLHGAGERGYGKDDLSAVDVHGFSKIIADRDIPAIFIMPQCPKDSFWVAKIESLLLFIDRVAQIYKCDRSRIYLTGFSMGGFGTWFTAMARPKLFAAIAPVCGGGMPWNAGVLTMPIWTFHGEEDRVVSPVLTEQMVDKLRERGRCVKYTLLTGVGHNAWDYSHNMELIEWLLSNKLK